MKNSSATPTSKVKSELEGLNHEQFDFLTQLAKFVNLDQRSVLSRTFGISDRVREIVEQNANFDYSDILESEIRHVLSVPSEFAEQETSEFSHQDVHAFIKRRMILAAHIFAGEHLEILWSKVLGDDSPECESIEVICKIERKILGCENLPGSKRLKELLQNRDVSEQMEILDRVKNKPKLVENWRLYLFLGIAWPVLRNLRRREIFDIACRLKLLSRAQMSEEQSFFKKIRRRGFRVNPASPSRVR